MNNKEDIADLKEEKKRFKKAKNVLQELELDLDYDYLANRLDDGAKDEVYKALAVLHSFIRKCDAQIESQIDDLQNEEQ